MRINPSEVARNLGQGGAQTSRLMAYLLLAMVLMAMDQRGHYVPRIRAALGMVTEPIIQVAELPARALRGLRTYGRSYDQLEAENEAQNRLLLGQAGDIQRLGTLEEENRRLRALLDASAGHAFEYRFAELVQVNLDPLAHRVTIDRGRSDGAFEGQAVIDGLGIMGQVESVYRGQSQVRLISDPDHALPVQILRTGQRTVAYGTGDPGRLLLPNLPLQSDVRPGDELVTSGLGDRFPAGFPVAIVEDIERDPGDAFARVVARPLAALDRGREVLLVLPVTPDPLPEPAPEAAVVTEEPSAEDPSANDTDADS